MDEKVGRLLKVSLFFILKTGYTAGEAAGLQQSATRETDWEDCRQNNQKKEEWVG